MTTGNDIQPERPLFKAHLTPHRSLNRTGFMLLMIAISVGSFAAGLAFLLIGAWPVLGFFALDALVIYWAFKVNFARAAAYEDISVSYTEMRVRRVTHRGHAMEWVFNPLWARLDCKVHEEFGLERLYVVSRGCRVSLGGFLGPNEKASFYKALNRAMQDARRGPTLNPIG